MKTIFSLFIAFIAVNSLWAQEVPRQTKDIVLPVASYVQSDPDTIIVPASIRTSFTTKYPKATSVVWYRYDPGPMKIGTDVWYHSLDANDYYVVFTMDDGDYIAWYDNGSWIRTSKTIDDTELPVAIQRAINSQYPGFTITDVDHEFDDKQEVYEVDLENGATKWTVHYSPTGSVIKKKERNLARIDAEQEMVTDFETRFPNASDVVWYRFSPPERVELLPTDWNYMLDANDYEVRFKWDGTDYIAWYDNGKWIRSETTVFDPLRLPATINDAIAKNYAGYKITDVDREETANRILYEVELENANEKCKIHYTADGAITKKKCTNGDKTKMKS